MNMSPNVLAELVRKTLNSGEQTPLTQEERRRFHEEFEELVSPSVDQMRAEKRKSYDRTQDLAFW